MKNKNFIQNQKNTNKSNKKTIAYYLAIVYLVITCLGSIFGTIAFVKSFKNNNHKESNISNYSTTVNTNTFTSKNTISTYDSNDEIINSGIETIKRFTASNIYIPLVRSTFSDNTANYNSTVANVFDFSFYFDYLDNHDGGMADGYSFRLYLRPFADTSTNNYITYKKIVNNSIYESNSYFPFSDVIDTQDGDLNNINYPNSVLYSCRFGSRSSSYKYQFYFKVNLKGGDYKIFDYPISKVEIGSEKVDWTSQASRYYIASFNGTNNQDLYYWNTVKYYQNEYLAYEFGFLTYKADNTSHLLENRSYYTLIGIEGKSDYELGYRNGKAEGIKEGIDSGTEDGFERGKILGESIGYDKGYVDGLDSANSNNFNSLLSAVVDVPINALRSLLNFDLLGFNLWNFFTAILTCGLVIFIIRLFI